MATARIWDNKSLKSCVAISRFKCDGEIIDDDGELSIGLLREYAVGVSGAFDVFSIFNHITKETTYIPASNVDWWETEQG